MLTINCSVCGRAITEFHPHPNRPGRIRGYCPCNPIGPVVETNAPDYPALTDIGVSAEIAGALWKAGLITVDDIRQADDETLLSIAGIGPVTLEKIKTYFEGE